MYYDNPKHSRPGNIALKIGLVAGLLMITIHLVFMLITQNRNSADFIAWIFEWFVFYFAARTAANRYSSSQQYNPAIPDPGSNVVGAGVGAALTTMILAWIFVVLRDVFLDVPSFATTIGLLRLPVDVLIALGLGALAGNNISGRNSHKRNPY